MASITIRNLEEGLKSRLRNRAARNGRYLEEEARNVLRMALAREEPAANLFEAIRRRFAKVGPVDLPIPPRLAMGIAQPRSLGGRLTGAGMVRGAPAAPRGSRRGARGAGGGR